MKFKISEDRCVGCQTCQLTCSAEKEGLLRMKPSRIHIVFGTSDYKENIVVCRQCKKCKCQEACTYGAFNKDAETGGVYIDYSLCQACMACVDACIFSAVDSDTDKGFPIVCDLCGGTTPCVTACNTGALMVA